MISRIRRFASTWLATFSSLARELKDLLYLPISFMPGSIGWRLRRFFLGQEAKIGKNVKIDEFVRIDHLQHLEVGDDSFVGRASFIHAGGGVIIGRDVLIGPGVKIWSVDHQFSDRSVAIRLQGHEFAPVVIEDDAWIGVDGVILKGVTIGRGAVVGAGSVVTKSVGAYQIVAGIPARLIGSR